MVYKVIGLMSGSSLDGLDIVHVQLDEVRGKWSYQVLHAECIPYSDEWVHQLRLASTISVPDFLRLHTAYGHYLGAAVLEFIKRYNIEHQVSFIASHGHTVFHEPGNRTTFQLGDGAALAATAGLPVISDLRSLDVALGGQGAPIVPIGDLLLFGGYDYLLNIGGIANITVMSPSGPLAFDICPANQVFNTLAAREGKYMDEDGRIAASGSVLHDLFIRLGENDYYRRPAPKSLSNEQATDMIFPLLLESQHSIPDLMHTTAVFVARQIAEAVRFYPHGKDEAAMLVTGGGAFNKFLVSAISEELSSLDVQVNVPRPEVVTFKEAIVMALIGTLRWREEENVLSRVTGASKSSVGGALWMMQ